MEINPCYVRDIEHNLVSEQVEEHKAFNEVQDLSELVKKSTEVVTVLDSNKAVAMWGLIEIDKGVVNFWMAITSKMNKIKLIRMLHKYVDYMKENYSLVVSVARPKNEKVIKMVKLFGFTVTEPRVFGFSDELFCRLDLKGNK